MTTTAATVPPGGEYVDLVQARHGRRRVRMRVSAAQILEIAQDIREKQAARRGS